jgi:lipopolysaccharide transport system permease protein
VTATAIQSLATMLSPWHIGATLWRHRELVWQFTLREIHIRHKGSQLGIVWALITPLSMLALYWFVFGVIFGQRYGFLAHETQLDFALALFLSLSLFHVFSETLGWSPSLIASNPNFVKKVVFPLEVLPAAKIGDTAFHLAVSLTLVLLGSAFGTTGLSWSALWLPVLVFPLLMLALGIAWTLSSIGVFLRDIGQATSFVATAVMFASAVPFPPSKILTSPFPQMWEILRFNPILQLIDLARHVLLWHEPMSWVKLGYVYGVALAVLLAGHLCFSLFRRSFAEVI